MKRVLVLFLILIFGHFSLCFSTNFAQVSSVLGPRSEKMVYPLPIRIQISGSFAELRKTHFHGGVDFRTKQREGIKVRAIHDGYIYKVTVSKKMYGKAAYIQHYNGLVSVYAHLSKFNKQIDALLDSINSCSITDTIDIVLDSLYIPIKKAKTFARSGNTGASAGPHLHFELRTNADTSLAFLINPNIFGLGVKDNTPPNIKTLAIYTDTSTIYIPKDSITDVYTYSGRIGFGIEALDSIEKMPFNYGLYSLLFKVDSDTLSYYKLDTMPIKYIDCIKYHVDQEFYNKTKCKIEKSFISQDQIYSPYSKLSNLGLLFTEKDKVYNIQIICSDFNGNESSVAFKIRTCE